jgi:hypothetical protein
VTRTVLFDRFGEPAPDFNKKVLGWMDGSIAISGRRKPAAFETLRMAYDRELSTILSVAGGKLKRSQAHRVLQSSLTNLMLGSDISKEIGERLSSLSINPDGFRSTLGQGVAKNTGENFINIIVYAIADFLQGQDEVLVVKGMPPELQVSLTLLKPFQSPGGKRQLFKLPIEGDLCIFARSNPHNAIVLSGKTRLKEVFHIGTMWKILFDMLDDGYCLKKWGLERVESPIEAEAALSARVELASTAEGEFWLEEPPAEVEPTTKAIASAGAASTKEILYVFATADMIPPGGAKTQGPDVERDAPRNLIAADASFFDYVFVSKTGIPHVSRTVDYPGPREALFHELGCLFDLIEQKFGVEPSD